MTAPVVTPNRAERRARGWQPTGFAYPGRFREEADRVFRFCEEHGFAGKRAYALACLASYGEKSWTFQRTVANFARVCVRTIQRAVRQGKRFGVLTTKRIPRGARPPGAEKRLDCGAAWKWFTAWGLPQGRAMLRCWRYAQGWLKHQANLDAWRERQREELAAAVAEFRERRT